MSQPTVRRVTPDESPAVRQKLQLVCKACGQRHTYDVGTIHVWMSEADAGSDSRGYGFTKYFRCCDCGSAGPWEMADYLKLIGLTLLAKASGGNERLVFATPTLFDGTIVQSPAQGEEHLLRLIAREPGNAFLHTRLGNLFRGCRMRDEGAAWYGKALALDAGDLEARYHLCWFAADDADHPLAIEHARSLVRHLLEGRKTNSDELTRGIAISVVEILREAPREARDELMHVTQAGAAPPEVAFIRTLLEAEGDEQAVVNAAADRLFRGEWGPASRAAPVERIGIPVAGRGVGALGAEVDTAAGLAELRALPARAACAVA